MTDGRQRDPPLMGPVQEVKKDEEKYEERKTK